MVPPTEICERRLLELFLGIGALRGKHRDPEPEERRIAVLDGPAPSKRSVAKDAPFDCLVEPLELDVGGRAPARGAGAGGLVDLQIRDGVLAEAVPVAIDKPG